jgi:hypothetical protein
MSVSNTPFPAGLGGELLFSGYVINSTNHPMCSDSDQDQE